MESIANNRFFGQYPEKLLLLNLILIVLAPILWMPTTYFMIGNLVASMQLPWQITLIPYMAVMLIAIFNLIYVPIIMINKKITGFGLFGGLVMSFLSVVTIFYLFAVKGLLDSI